MQLGEEIQVLCSCGQMVANSGSLYVEYQQKRKSKMVEKGEHGGRLKWQLRNDVAMRLGWTVKDQEKA